MSTAILMASCLLALGGCTARETPTSPTGRRRSWMLCRLDERLLVRLRLLWCHLTVSTSGCPSFPYGVWERPMFPAVAVLCRTWAWQHRSPVSSGAPRAGSAVRHCLYTDVCCFSCQEESGGLFAGPRQSD